MRAPDDRGAGPGNANDAGLLVREICSGPLVRPPRVRDATSWPSASPSRMASAMREHDLVRLQEAEALGAVHGRPRDERPVGDDLSAGGPPGLLARRALGASPAHAAARTCDAVVAQPGSARARPRRDAGGRPARGSAAAIRAGAQLAEEGELGDDARRRGSVGRSRCARPSRFVSSPPSRASPSRAGSRAPSASPRSGTATTRRPTRRAAARCASARRRAARDGIGVPEHDQLAARRARRDRGTSTGRRGSRRRAHRSRSVPSGRGSTPPGLSARPPREAIPATCSSAADR